METESFLIKGEPTTWVSGLTTVSFQDVLFFEKELKTICSQPAQVNVLEGRKGGGHPS